MSLARAKVVLLLVNEQTTRESRWDFARLVRHLPDPPMEAMSRSVDRNASVNHSRLVELRRAAGHVSVHPGWSFAAGGVSTMKKKLGRRAKAREGWKGGRRSVTFSGYLSHSMRYMLCSTALATVVCFQLLLGLPSSKPYSSPRTPRRVPLLRFALPLAVSSSGEARQDVGSADQRQFEFIAWRSVPQLCASHYRRRPLSSSK